MKTFKTFNHSSSRLITMGVIASVIAINKMIDETRSKDRKQD